MGGSARNVPFLRKLCGFQKNLIRPADAGTEWRPGRVCLSAAEREAISKAQPGGGIGVPLFLPGHFPRAMRLFGRNIIT